MASIPEQIINAGFAALPGGVSHSTGRRETEGYQAPPYVVAVPLGAPEISPPDRVGAARYSDGSGNEYASRILLVRKFRIEWQCFGAPTDPAGDPDFTDAENLYLSMLVILRNLYHDAIAFSGEEWVDQQDGADSHERYGTSIKFFSIVSLPVYDTTSYVVALTASPKIVTDVTLGTETVVVNNG